MSGSAPILIVDDNASKRFALRAILAPLGYRIVEADSGVAALRRVVFENFAVILLDVCMPITDGFETAALIRKRRQSEATPIIFVTAFDSGELARTGGYAEGAVDFIFAPVNPAELRAKVSVFVNIFSRADDLAVEAREVKASADRLRVLTDAAVAATAMQKSFAASAAHELRTPTTSILGYTEEVLESTSLSAQDRGFLEVVYRNARRLSQLIDDLLILDQAEIGASMMHLVPTALAPLADRVMSNFFTAARHGEVTLVAEYAPVVPDVVVDPLRLEQALTNLVSNAIKFTPPGGVVKVGIRHVGEAVHLSVADTGVGIDPADLGSIFDRFYRTKTAIDSAVKGSGLGLAIAKKMVEAQNGRMHVTSDLGHGSTFTMTLPITTRTLQAVR